jgi:S-(hydroxymethyl)glutathione dehydrogenase/alcohol dehydrogenase
MKTRAAVLWTQPGEWQVEDVEIAEPQSTQVLVEMVATGLCRSDEHVASGAVPLLDLPLCAGHEGSGIVREVGTAVRTLRRGDHIVTTFIPACGLCGWCASGMQNLCDAGMEMIASAKADGRSRMTIGDVKVSAPGTLGTFTGWQVFDERSCVKVDEDVPLDVACLLGCGVPTGWGAAVNSADVQPGDVVVIMGVGGVGINAVQGAKHAGAAQVIAVDPVEFKRSMALKLGATSVFEGMVEATDYAMSVTNGLGADAVIIAGEVSGAAVAEGVRAIRKAGTVVITSQGSIDDKGLPVSLFELSMYQKRIQGSLYGGGSPRELIPRLLEMYRSGSLHLDELITRRYALEQINDAFRDLQSGVNMRGIIEFSRA